MYWRRKYWRWPGHREASPRSEGSHVLSRCEVWGSDRLRANTLPAHPTTQRPLAGETNRSRNPARWGDTGLPDYYPTWSPGPPCWLPVQCALVRLLIHKLTALFMKSLSICQLRWGHWDSYWGKHDGIK